MILTCNSPKQTHIFIKFFFNKDLLSECSSINDEENDDERMISATAASNTDYDNEFDEDYDDEFEDDDFDEYLSMKYDNKFNKASANSRSLMPNSFGKQMNPAKSKGKQFVILKNWNML